MGQAPIRFSVLFFCAFFVHVSKKIDIGGWLVDIWFSQTFVFFFKLTRPLSYPSRLCNGYGSRTRNRCVASSNPVWEGQ